MAKGKGNKLIVLKGEDRIVAAAVVPPKTPLVFTSGKRTMTLKPSDVDTYMGARASRGNFLPRGYRAIDKVSAGS
jgi:topoisomerase-4 subunit A